LSRNKRSHILVIEIGLSCLVIFIFWLKVLAILNGVVSLKQQLSNAILIFKVQWSQSDDIVAIDHLSDLPVQRLHS